MALSVVILGPLAGEAARARRILGGSWDLRYMISVVGSRNISTKQDIPDDAMVQDKDC